MRTAIISVLSVCVISCASNEQAAPPLSEVLEPAETAAETTPIDSPTLAAAEKLKTRLEALGYQGVGMEVETIEVLDILTAVFSDPSVARRKIKTIYTGALNDYDPSHESVTLSTAGTVKSILAFIKKKVPLRKQR